MPLDSKLISRLELIARLTIKRLLIPKREELLNDRDLPKTPYIPRSLIRLVIVSKLLYKNLLSTPSRLRYLEYFKKLAKGATI